MIAVLNKNDTYERIAMPLRNPDDADQWQPLFSTCAGVCPMNRLSERVR